MLCVLALLVVLAHASALEVKGKDDEVDRLGQMRVKPVGAYATRCATPCRGALGHGTARATR